VRLRRILREFAPDVVHARLFLTQLSPLVLPLLRNVPSIYQAVWYRSVCPIGTKLLPDGRECRVRAGVVCHRTGCLSWPDWFLAMIQRRLFRRWRDSFDHVVAISESVQLHLRADEVRVDEVRGNAVVERPARPPLGSEPMAAFAGRLVREKGVDVLLRAFRGVAAELPDAHLLIAGDGPDRRKLTELTRGLGIDRRVSFIGHVTREELERRFDRAWVQAVPSLWREPFGNVAAEALMRGTALIGTDGGGLARLIRKSGGGLLVPTGDVEALTDALLVLMRNPIHAEEFGAAGRLYALRELHMSTYVDWLESLYAQVATGYKSRRLSPAA
jgi:glycosyltransferase involved in cell wall biosynthesis